MSAMSQTEIFSAYHGKVLGYIRSRVNNMDDAEDLCSDVFVKVFTMMESYDQDKASVSTWIYTIAHNTVIDYYRRNRATDELPDALTDNSSFVDEVIQEEQLEELAEALERLPDELVDIIVMRYYDSLSLTDIAKKLGLSYGVVKIKHQKALMLLRTELAS